MSGRHYGAAAAVIGLPCEHPETAPLARCRACRRSRCHTRWGGMPAYGAIPTVVASADAGRSCPILAVRIFLGTGSIGAIAAVFLRVRRAARGSPRSPMC